MAVKTIRLTPEEIEPWLNTPDLNITLIGVYPFSGSYGQPEEPPGTWQIDEYLFIYGEKPQVAQPAPGPIVMPRKP